MARILLVGALSGDLATVARLAGQGGALVKLAGSVTVAMSTLRQNAALDVIICDVAAGVAALIGAMRAERMSVRVIAAARDMTAAQATMAIQAGRV